MTRMLCGLPYSENRAPNIFCQGLFGVDLCFCFSSSDVKRYFRPFSQRNVT